MDASAIRASAIQTVFGIAITAESMITRPAVGSVSDLAGWQVFHWCCSFVRARPGRLVAAVGGLLSAVCTGRCRAAP